MRVRAVEGGGETGSCGELGVRALPLTGLQLLHHLLVACLIARLKDAAHHSKKLVVVWRSAVTLLNSLQPCQTSSICLYRPFGGTQQYHEWSLQ